MVKFILVSLTLLAIVLFGFLAPLFKEFSAVFAYVAYALVIVALLISFARGGLESYPFWVTLIAGYPVITPFIVQNVFGYNRFTAWGTPELQKVDTMGCPLMLAALSCLFLSIAISKISVKADPVKIENLPKKKNDLIFWLVVSVIGMLFFAWLTEPGSPIGMVTYSELRTQRIQGVPFAGAAWAVFAILGLGLYRKLEFMANDRTQKIGRRIFWFGVISSIIYLLMHARRSETSGYIILLFCVFGNRISIFKKFTSIFVAFSVLAVVGFIRTKTEIAAMLLTLSNRFSLPSNSAVDYFQPPGAPGNIFMGFLSAYHLMETKALNFFLGKTYFDHILRLPPKLLGLSRPRISYKYLKDFFDLAGGDYFLSEPLMNFGVIGIVIYLIVFASMTNWSIRHMRKYFDGKSGSIQFLVAGIFVASIFRTIWYGLGAVIKGLIVAWLVSFMFVIMWNSVRRVKKTCL